MNVIMHVSPTRDMNHHSGTTESVWMRDLSIPARPPLAANDKADVCIVGAGIAGMMTAYMLASDGKKVVVLDDGPIAGGETERTTAHLASALDDRFYRLEQLFGEEGAKLAAESHSRAIDEIERIVQAEKIDCDFVRLPGYLFVPPDDDQGQLDDELAAAERAGLQVKKVDRAPIKDFDTGPALEFQHQGQFHPTKYLRALEDMIEKRGGRIYTGTHAKEFVGGKNSYVETSDGHRVRAAHIVVATNSPVNDRYAIHTKQAAYRTFVIAGRVPKASVDRALYWDTPDPYHYVRIQEFEEHDLIIVGGEDHKTGQANDAPVRFQRLEQWTKKRFPMMQDVLHRWSGQVMEPVDSLAFIGRNPADEDNVYIATGDSGHGMTHGTIAGMLIGDLIMGRPNPWEDLYDPARKNPKSLKEFAKENINVAAEYTDLVTGGDVSSEEDIQAGSGAIMRKGLKKIALYRDDAGTLHQFSAVCPHLGCIVSWNSTEKSWDCPCHGSRYTSTGDVVNGPSKANLSLADQKPVRRKKSGTRQKKSAVT